MKTTFLILTLITVFISSVDAAPLKIQLSIMDGDCYEIELDQHLGVLPADGQESEGSFYGFCDAYGGYKILKERGNSKSLITLDYRNSEIDISGTAIVSDYGDDSIWIFDESDKNLLTPLSMILSSYIEILIDEANNIWEPQEVFKVVALRGLSSCVVGEIVSGPNSDVSWSQAIAVAEKSKNLSCL